MINSAKLVAALAVAGLAATACSGTATTTTASTSAALTACPQSTPAGGMPSGGAGRPSGAAGMAAAKTIKKEDPGDSVVVNPTGPQIHCGQNDLTAHNDVVYASPAKGGKQTTLRMNILTPKTTGDKPVVIYLPGGGFMMADRTQNLDQRTYIAEQGYVVVGLQYRTTADGAIYSDAVTDVKSAVRFLRAHAKEYGIDAGKIAVWGQSAGGYLAAMTGVTNGDKHYDAGDNLDQSSDVQAVVDQFGPSNLSTVGDDYDDAAKASNVAPGNNLAQWVYGAGTTRSVQDYTPEVAAADPDTHVSSTTPPFVLFHGTADQLVSPSQTRVLADTLKAKGVSETRYLVQGGNHGDLAFTGDTTSPKYWTTQAVLSKITDFLASRLR